MSIAVSNFSPNSNYTIAASGTSTNIALTQPSEPGGSGGNRDLQIFNSAAAPAFARWGEGTLTATTSDYVIAPGAIQVVRMGSNYTSLAVILSTGTGNVYVSLGSGS